MTRRPSAIWTTTALLVPFVGILIAHATHYLPFISDDALISLRYASRLLEGHGLTWTEGPRVEGYSNLLWILLIALLGGVGIDLIVAARTLGLLGMTAVLFALSYGYTRRYPLYEIWFPLTVALLFLVLGGPIAVWAIGGLEQPLYGALLATAVALMFSVLDEEPPRTKTWLWLSAVLGLMCLTRPDGPIFTAAAIAALMLAHATSGRRRWLWPSVLLLTFPVILGTGQLAFRFFYYGEFVPNTALVKLPGGIARWQAGTAYLRGGFESLAPLSYFAILSIVAMVLSRRSRNKGVYLALLVVSWGGYLAYIGGDIFPAYRHFVPLMVVFAFALAHGAVMLVGRLGPGTAATKAVSVLGLLLLVPYTNNQLTDRQNQRAARERWEWECKELATTLKHAFHRQQPLVAVTAAGCLPYWSMLPSLDMLGLNDHYLPRHPPADVGQGFIGHELGDGAYVLRRNPDIIVFNVGSGPHYRSGEELDGMSEFHARYLPIRVQAGLDVPPIVYFNRYSTKTGLRFDKSDSRITIPGFFFAGSDGAAYLRHQQILIIEVPPASSASFVFASEESLDGWVAEVRTFGGAEVVGHVRQSGSSASVTIENHSSRAVEIQEVVLRPSTAGAPRPAE